MRGITQRDRGPWSPEDHRANIAVGVVRPEPIRSALLALLCSVSCSTDPGIIRVEGGGFFTPARLEYGTQPVGDPHELTTILLNASADQLLVEDLRFEPPQEVYAAFLTNGGTLRGTVLEPNQSVEITLVFRPIADGDYDATLVVESTSIEIPLEIQARAQRVLPARPELDPSQVRFLGTEVGRDVSQRVRVSNAGQTSGRLSVVATTAPFSVTAADGSPLSLPSPSLAPGEGLDVQVHYLAEAPGYVEGNVSFRFDTGTQADLPVSGDSIQPAVMTCDTSVVDLGDLTRGRSASARVRCTTDAGPYVLQTVRMATGSSEHFTLNPAQPRLNEGLLDFEVQFDGVGLPGQYDALIEIVPAHQVVTRVAATAQVLPPLQGESDLEIEMRWNTGNSDFDLHLVRLDGVPFEFDKDCYFDFVHPDWGQENNVADDPVLTTDDVNGFGPETMSLLRAGEPHYDLWVQFFGYDRDVPPSTTVVVTYQLRGQSPQMVSQDLLQCGVAWHVGRFSFDANGGRFTPAGELVMDYQPRASAVCRP